MAYYLASLGSGFARFATIPTVTFASDFEIRVIASQATNATFIFAGSGVAGQNGLDLYRNNSGNYQLFINNAGAITTTTSVSSVATSPDSVVVRRVAGVVELLINGVSRGTVSNSATLRVDRLFHRNGWSIYGVMALYEFTVISGGSYNTSWNAANSPSTGSTWTSTNGQVLTQSTGWPAGNSEWIYYDDGGAITSTIAATWPQLTVAANHSATVPDVDSAISYNWPQISVSVAQQSTLPVSSSVAFNWPQLSVSADQSSTAPQFDSAVNLTWPQLSVSASQSAEYSGNVINITWPQLSVLANQSATIPELETAVVFTWPQLSIQTNQVTPVENPEYNFPISSYGNNNQWRFSPFFKQTR